MTAFLPGAKNRKDALPRCGEAQGDGKSPGDGKPLVLVVEDHEDTRFLLTYLLDVRGCAVKIARDGEEAVHMAEAMRPGLILMDINLPHMDGLAATRRMREIAALESVPVIFLSGRAEASFRAEALSQGGDDYLVKPFALAELERILERYLGKNVAAKATQPGDGFLL